MKPAELYVGVIELFAVLCPGAVATWLCLRYGPLPAELAPGSFTEAGGYTAFLLASWLLGHLLFRAGAGLDHLYDRRRRRIYTAEDDSAYLEATRIRRQLTPALPASYSTFKWAKGWLQAHAPQGLAQVESLEANSKFFRGLTVLSATVGALVLLLPDGLLRGAEAWPKLGVAAAALALTYACFLGYVDYRWKSTQQACLLVVLAVGGKPRPPGPDTQEVVVDRA